MISSLSLESVSESVSSQASCQRETLPVSSTHAVKAKNITLNEQNSSLRLFPQVSGRIVYLLTYLFPPHFGISYISVFYLRQRAGMNLQQASSCARYTRVERALVILQPN